MITREAQIVELMYHNLKEIALLDSEIGIITPYNAQVSLLKRKLNCTAEISTVDGFQGREKEVIVISLVRSNPNNEVGFLSNARRMNVAITRAKSFICLIGDSATISSNEFLGRMVKYFSENGNMISAKALSTDIEFNIGAFANQPKPKKQKVKEGENVKKNKSKKESQAKQTEERGKDGTNERDQKEADVKEELDEKVKALIQQVKDFSVAKVPECIELANLTSYERLKIHELAETLGLYHQSKDAASGRVLILKRILKEEKAEEIKVTETKTTEIQDTKNEITHKAVKNIENTPPIQENNETIQKKEKHKDIVENSNDKKDNEIKDVKPTENAKKPKEKKQKNKEADKEVDKKEEQDIDSLLDSMISANKVCNFQSNEFKCTTSIALLGRNCFYCKLPFCIKHIACDVHQCREFKKEATADAGKPSIKDRLKDKLTMLKK